MKAAGDCVRRIPDGPGPQQASWKFQTWDVQSPACQPSLVANSGSRSSRLPASTWRGRPGRGSGEELLDDLRRFDAGEPLVEALRADGEAFVVEA